MCGISNELARPRVRSLTDDDLNLPLLVVSAGPFVTDPCTPEQEAERRGEGGVVEVHLLGLHLAVVHNPHLHKKKKQGKKKERGGGGQKLDLKKILFRMILQYSVGMTTVSGPGKEEKASTRETRFTDHLSKENVRERACVGVSVQK